MHVLHVGGAEVQWPEGGGPFLGLERSAPVLEGADSGGERTVLCDKRDEREDCRILPVDEDGTAEGGLLLQRWGGGLGMFIAVY